MFKEEHNMLRLKKCIAFTIAVIMVITLLPGATLPALAAEGDFTLSYNKLIRYNGTGGDVIIPEDMGITAIGDSAFEYCASLISVVLPDSVTTIGESAFKNCTNLKTVTIPESVKSIGDSAFYSCTNLTTVNIPEGVKKIQGLAFAYCESLTAITIPESVTEIGNLAFRNCGLTSITIPEGVTMIGTYAFQQNSNLNTVTFMGNPATINTSPFQSVPARFTVTYDSQGGTTVTQSKVVPAANIGTLVNPTRAGYVFGGWYKEAECTNAWNMTSNYVLRDITLYANWIKAYNVAFDSNGGGGSMNPVQVGDGLSYTLPACKFTAPSGKKFKGWATEATGTVITGAITVSKETTLFAIWEDDSKEEPIPSPDPIDPIEPTEPTDPSGSTVVQSETSDNAAIDLSAESIDLGGFTVAAYSVDGGKKWTKGALPTGDKFTKLFDKDLTLWVVDKWNSADIKEGKTVVEKKGVAPDAAYIKFPKINKRPKANAEKLVVNYAICADSSGATNGNWTLAKKDATTATIDGYEYGLSSDGKKVSSWSDVPAAGTPLGTGKTKTTYLVRSKATDTTPASKPFKVSVSNLSAAPKYKIDYKTEVIKLKKGDTYQIGTSSSIKVTEAKGINLDVSAAITNNSSIYVWKAADAKKPASEKQTITPLVRAEINDMILIVEDGKIKDNLSAYEFYNPGTKKWGSLPKVSAAAKFDVRKKATTTLAASVKSAIDISWGVCKVDSKGKETNGITEAFIGE